MVGREGKCVICSAPSGAGKTTIVHYLLRQLPELAFSVSATSRPMRPNERQGVDYHFLSPEEFAKRIREEAFVEWEEVYPGRFYGTLRSEVERIWAAGKHAIFDLDVVGGLHLKERFGPQALAIFIEPPSLEVLAERLRQRGTETAETLKVRVDKAGLEMETADRFDAVVVNHALDQACAEALDLVRNFLRK
ncbi:MAG: guanylate kinase [Flavobacteriales bacterium]|nr:guanylate kinase [Flavobacteriales bacterium]